jgi:hypothetical protein
LVGIAGTSIAGRIFASEQDLAQLLVQRDRCVRGAVDAASDTGFDLAERNLAADQNRRFQAGAAGLLDIERRGFRRQAGGIGRFAGQVEIARMLEYRAGDDFAEPFAV